MDSESMLNKIDKIWKDLEMLEEDILNSNLPRKNILARMTKKATWTLEDLENSIMELDGDKRSDHSVDLQFIPSSKFQDTSASPKLPERKIEEPPEPKIRQIPADSEFFRLDGENMWMKLGPQRMPDKDEKNYGLVTVKRVERDVKNGDATKRQFRFDASSVKANPADKGSKGQKESFGFQTTGGRVNVAVDCKRLDREMKTDMTNDRG
jgi:hypothetical protein